MLDTLSPAREPAATTSRSAMSYRPLVGTAVLLALVVGERWLLASHTLPGDAWAARLGASQKWWPVWDITRLYQQVGRPLVAIGEVLVIAWWLWRGGERRALAELVSLPPSLARLTGDARALTGLVVTLAASVCCGTIKIICGPTPFWRTLPHHVGTNFPSGVVTFATATGGYLALVAWRRGHRWATVVLIVAIAGAGPARVVGGQHLLSDVIGGYLLGVAWLLAAGAYLMAPGGTSSRRPRRVLEAAD